MGWSRALLQARFRERGQESATEAGAVTVFGGARIGAKIAIFPGRPRRWSSA